MSLWFRALVLVLFLASPASAQYISGAPAPVGGGTPVGGSCATLNAIAKFTANSTLGCSLTTDDGINVAQASGEHRVFGSSTLFTGASTNSLGSYLLTQSTVKPSAPTAALAGAGAGNVDNGTHVYCVTFITATGETECSTSSASVNVVDKTVNGKVTVTFTTSGFSGVTGRNVYRSKAGTATPLFLVATSPVVNDNTTTTYTDNIADASLTATTSPSANTTDDARVTLANVGNLTLVAGATLGWSDVPLVRDAAAVLALKNGTTQQTLRVYSTTTGNKYAFISHNGTDGFIDSSAGYIVLGGTANIGLNGNLSHGPGNQSVWGTSQTSWDVGIARTTAGNLKITDSGAGIGNLLAGQLRAGSAPTTSLSSSVFIGSVTFTSLGAQDNGTIAYCSDCDPALTMATCTHAGAQTGAFAFRVNGAWICGG